MEWDSECVCLPGERRLSLLREGQITAGGGTLRSIMSFVFFIRLSRRLVYWSQLQCHNNKKLTRVANQYGFNQCLDTRVSNGK